MDDHLNELVDLGKKLSTNGRRPNSRRTSSPTEPTDTPAAVEHWRQVMAARSAEQAAVCQRCQGLRFITAPADGGPRRYQPCPDCNTPAAVDAGAQMADESGLTERERSWTLDKWDESKPDRVAAVLYARQLLARRHGWLTLFGSFGPGKSFLGCALVNAAIASGTPAQYWVLADLLDALRAGFAKDADESYSALYERVSDCPVLVIDECHAFNATDWALSEFRQLVTRRYRLMRQAATVWIMNLEPRIDDKRLPGALDFLYSKMREGDLCELRGDVREQVSKARRKAKTGPLGEAQAPLLDGDR